MRKFSVLISSIVALVILNSCAIDNRVVVHPTEDGKVMVERHPRTVPKPISKSKPSSKTKHVAKPLKVRIINEYFELPLTSQQMNAQGWKLDDRFIHEGAGKGQFFRGILYHKNGRVLRALSGNSGPTPFSTMADATIAGLDLLPRNGQKPPAFGIPGLAYQGMTKEELIQRLGKPAKEEPWGENLALLFQQDFGEVLITLDKEDRVEGIRIDHLAFPGKEELETSINNIYWGEDPTTGRMFIDGDFFRLPGKVRHFQTSGWNVIDGPKVLEPGLTDRVKVQKGNYVLILGVKNNSEKKRSTKNLRVISVKPEDVKSEVPIQITQTLKTGISESDTFAFIRIYAPEKSQLDEQHWFTIRRPGYYIAFMVDAKKDRLLNIEYTKEYFPWEDHDTEKQPVETPMDPNNPVTFDIKDYSNPNNQPKSSKDSLNEEDQEKSDEKSDEKSLEVENQGKDQSSKQREPSQKDNESGEAKKSP